MSMSSKSTAERRKLSREARDAFPAMGVYAIRNQATGKVHVGSSRNAPGTLNRIQFELRLGTHPDKALQRAWQRAPSLFAFEVLELLKERSDPAFDYASELSDMEQMYRTELCPGSDE